MKIVGGVHFMLMNHNNTNIEVINFNSIRDFMAVEPSIAQNKETFVEGVKSHIEDGRAHLKWWYGSESMEEVKRICSSGWVEGMRIYENVKRQLPETDILGDFHLKYARKRKYSDSGDEVDIDRYIHQEFDTMFFDHKKYIQDKEGKIITLYTSIGFTCDISSNEALWGGITSTVLADVFESVGYRVNIVGFRAGFGSFIDYNTPSKSQINIQVKLPDMPLDLTNVLTAIAYPGFYRYYGFKAISSFPYVVSNGFGKSIGSPFIYEKNSFVIGGIRDSTTAHLKIMEILNTVKRRNTGVLNS